MGHWGRGKSSDLGKRIPGPATLADCVTLLISDTAGTGIPKPVDFQCDRVCDGGRGQGGFEEEALRREM